MRERKFAAWWYEKILEMGVESVERDALRRRGEILRALVSKLSIIIREAQFVRARRPL